MRMLRGGGALLAGCVLVAAGCSSSGPSPGSDAPIDALDGMQPGDTAPEADGAGDAADGTSGSDGAVADGADVPEADGGDAPTPDAGGDAPGGDAAPPDADAGSMDADAGDPFENCSTKPTITSIEANLFEPSCTFSACHDSESPSGGLELTPGEARDNLVGVPAENKDAEDWVRVEPGSPEASFLLHRLAGPDPIGGYMPPDQDDPPIEPACRIEAVEAWIADGAPPAE